LRDVSLLVVAYFGNGKASQVERASGSGHGSLCRTCRCIEIAFCRVKT